MKNGSRLPDRFVGRYHAGAAPDERAAAGADSYSLCQVDTYDVAMLVHDLTIKIRPRDKDKLMPPFIWWKNMWIWARYSRGCDHGDHCKNQGTGAAQP